MGRSTLHTLTLLHYSNRADFFGLKRWLRIREKMPAVFQSRISGISKRTTISALLRKIDKELMRFYGKKRNNAHSFADSRFTPLPQMMKRGLVSCGAMTKIFGTALRMFGIPVKFVHGRLKGQRGSNRHAWLKIYSPMGKKWIAIDPTQNHRNFAVKPNARQVKIYADWRELQGDYRKGKF